MAGFYPDVPGRRRAYDRDGSIGFGIDPDTLAVSTMSSTRMAHLNSENPGVESVGWGGGAGAPWDHIYRAGFIFPAAVDLVGWFIGGATESPGGGHVSTTWAAVETSANTTSGLDGTWTDHGSDPIVWPPSPAYRTDIQLLSVSGINAVRFAIDNPGAGGNAIHTIHVYTVDYSSVMRLWHPTSSAELTAAYFDWGDVAQGETYERQFRVHNTDASRTATSITVGTDVLTDATTPLGAQVSYSDGGAFASSINIGNLAAGATSGVLTCRYSVAAGADAGPWAWRTVAEPATLT